MIKCKSKEGVELLFLEVKEGSTDFTIINDKFYYKNRKGKIKFIKKILPKDFSIIGLLGDITKDDIEPIIDKIEHPFKKNQIAYKSYLQKGVWISDWFENDINGLFMSWDTLVLNLNLDKDKHYLVLKVII